MVSIFDPAANAFREVTLEVALQFIESAKELEARLNASVEEDQ
jgi:hypothetical protein